LYIGSLTKVWSSGA